MFTKAVRYESYYEDWEKKAVTQFSAETANRLIQIQSPTSDF